MRALVAAIGLSLLLVGVAPAADSLNVRLVGRYDSPGRIISDVAVEGDYLYVLDYGSALRVISVADPANPTEVGSCAGWGEYLAVGGGYAYLAASAKGLRVISVADPAHPTEVGSCGGAGFATDVAASGTLVYVADGQPWSLLRIFSVSDPAHPTGVGGCTVRQPTGIALNGAYAYVADYDSGLRVISVVDSAHPVEVGHADTPGKARGIAVSGDFAYVADYDSGLQVISVANPASPAVVGHCDALGRSRAVAIAGAHAFVSDVYTVWGLRVASLADPAHPVEVGYYRTGTPRCLAVGGDYAYVVVGESVLLVCQFYGAGVEEGLKPHASSPKLEPTVERSLPQGAVVFDAMGRRVLSPRSGVFFIREAPAVGRGPSAIPVRKVVVRR